MFTTSSEFEPRTTALLIDDEIFLAITALNFYSASGEIVGIFTNLLKLAPCFAESFERYFEYCLVMLYKLTLSIDMIHAIVILPVCDFLKNLNHAVASSWS
jgi:hypothetical protein